MLSRKSQYWKTTTAGALALSLLMAGTVNAQEQSLDKKQEKATGKVMVEKTETRRPSAAREVEETREVNQFLASRLILCNNQLIDAAQMIQGQTESEEVKALARKLAEDHRNFNTQLKSLAAPYSVQAKLPEWTSEAASEKEEKAEDATARAATRASQTAKLVAGSEVTDVTNPDRNDGQRPLQETSLRTVEAAPLKLVYMIAIEAADVRSKQCQEMLQRYEGYDRDMAYVGSEIAAHQMMLSELKAITQSTSGPLKDVAQQGVTMIEGHLQSAVQLSQALETMKDEGIYRHSDEKNPQSQSRNVDEHESDSDPKSYGKDNGQS